MACDGVELLNAKHYLSHKERYSHADCYVLFYLRESIKKLKMLFFVENTLLFVCKKQKSVVSLWYTKRKKYKLLKN